MTLYCVEYRAGSAHKIETFDSMIERALFLISMALYIDVIRVYEVAA